MVLTFAASAVLTSLLLRGDLKRLGQLDFKNLYWILASFVLRDGAEEIFKGRTPQTWSSILLALACYALLFYGIFPNLRLPGMWAVAAGSGLNFLVILANQGRMPVSVAPLSAAEQVREVLRLSTSINHQLLGQGTSLFFLSDLFKWTFLQPKPVMFSAGDVLLSAGVFWLILRTSLRGFPPSDNDGRID